AVRISAPYELRLMLLVTGGAGFIGSNFVLSSLALADEPIVNLDKLTYAGNLRNLGALRGDGRHVFLRGDIRDRALLKQTLERHRRLRRTTWCAPTTRPMACLPSRAIAPTTTVRTSSPRSWSRS